MSTDLSIVSRVTNPFITAYERGDVLPYGATLEFFFDEPLKLTPYRVQQLAQSLCNAGYEAAAVQDKAYPKHPYCILNNTDDLRTVLCAVSVRCNAPYVVDEKGQVDFGFARIKSSLKTFISKLHNVGETSKGGLFPSKTPLVKRTGVRLVHIVKLNQPHISEFEKEKVFNPAWLAGFTGVDHKVRQFVINLVPRVPADSKDSAGMDDINLDVHVAEQAAVMFKTDDDYSVETAVPFPVELNLTRGYLWDNSYNYDRLEDTLEFAEKNYLEWFRPNLSDNTDADD